jgi:WXXGXW repeat (2 copies)
MKARNAKRSADGTTIQDADGVGIIEAGRERRHSGTSRMAKTLLGAGLGLTLMWGIAGCHQNQQQSAANNPAVQNGPDPADANMAPAGAGGYAPAQQQPAQVMGQSAQYAPQQQGEDYSQQQQPPAPIVRQAPDSGDQGPDNSTGTLNSDGTMSDAQAQQVYDTDLTGDQTTDPPPQLPDYDQPPAPDPDYLWTPGYWAWGPGGYYWVPGVWVGAPYAGALWTPGYWGFVGGFYRWHHGYWGTHIGFYGGVDYGYGYVGHGYYGGYWNGGHFFYNSAVTRVNVNVIHNVYVHNVVVNNVVVNNRITNRVSYAGGRGGLAARPLPAEVAVLHEQRIPPMAAQVQVQHEAAQNKQQFYNENHGRPAEAFAARPVVADRTLPPALPRVAPAVAPRAAGPVAQPNLHGEQQGFHEVRPGQPQTPAQATHPPAWQQVHPQGQAAPQVHSQMQPTPARPTPEFHPVQPAQQNRPEPQPQMRPEPQQGRPVEPNVPAHPVQEARPAPAPQNTPRPEERAAPQPAAHPATPPPHPQARPAPPPPKPPPPKPEERPRSR